MVTLQELNYIVKIVGKHSSQDVNIMLKFKEVMYDLRLNHYIPQPTLLVQTCTGYNCVCWRNGIKGICIPYHTCLRCYNDINGLNYCKKCD